MRKHRRTASALMAGAATMTLLALGWRTFAGHRAEPRPFFNVPETVSPEAQTYLARLPDPAERPSNPAADDVEGWQAAQQKIESNARSMDRLVGDRYQSTVTKRSLGGTPVLDIKPSGWHQSPHVLVYTHGGGYTTFSAHSTLDAAAAAAEATGFRVISIDYSLAPRAKWPQVTNEVVAAVQALRREGHPLDDIAMCGDSAGGGLVAGSVLKMRDQGLGIPAALILRSPWADITDSGDSAVTLKQAETLYLYDKHLKSCADAYADPKDQKNPYVSPVYGDFSKGFPPTLIQGGTKETFLSHFVRLYQAIDGAGQSAKLDLYDGMPHCFQVQMPESPEGQSALHKMSVFLGKHIGHHYPHHSPELWAADYPIGQ